MLSTLATLDAALVSSAGMFAQRSSSSAGSGAAIGIFLVFFGVMMVFSIGLYVFYSYCLARIFRRAGITEWWAWVPYVSSYGLWKLTARDTLWLILLFVPYANIVATVVIMIDVAKSFGKSEGYGWGLGLLGIVFVPMLAFDNSPYLGPAPVGPAGWVPPGGYGTAPPGYVPHTGQVPYAQPPYGQPAAGQPPYQQPPYGQAPPAAAPHEQPPDGPRRPPV